MTFDEWWKEYKHAFVSNDAMARHCWDTAVSAEREAILQICDRHYMRMRDGNYPHLNMYDIHIQAEIRKRSGEIAG